VYKIYTICVKGLTRDYSLRVLAVLVLGWSSFLSLSLSFLIYYFIMYIIYKYAQLYSVATGGAIIIDLVLIYS